MALIRAVIMNKENTLITEFPENHLKIYKELQSVGIRRALDRIWLTDEEGGDIRVKLYSESDLGNHLICLFSASDTLSAVNSVAYAVQNADDSIQEELEQKLLCDRYSGIGELLCDIREMTGQIGRVKMSFFCPLVGNLADQEYGDYLPVGNSFLKSYEWEIRELLEMEQNAPEDAMAQFYDDDESIKAKLVSAVWTVDEYRETLYGRIDCRFREELTEEETEAFKRWLVGQNADGFGEHFEQQPIDTEDGDLFVSFWNSSVGYFLCTEDELDDCVEESQGLQLGGM